jgi:hypothetical protein
MEKYGVVKAGITPEEKDKKQNEQKSAAAAELDGDFRKCAAVAAQNALKQ